MKNNKVKIALVHDYLKSDGGAERVLIALHQMYPRSPIYTIYNRIDSTVLKEKLKGATIVQSWYGKLPLAYKLMSPLRFLLPFIWSSFDFSEFDLVISSSSWAITKGFSSTNTKELCYCHTPPRYLYGYETSRNWKKFWYVRLYALIVNHFMRMYDFTQSQKVTQFVANSNEVSKRIQKFYRRDSIVIYPPVEVFPVKQVKKTKDYYLTGGRFTSQKNFDLIIEACERSQKKLIIYGSGVQEKYLKSKAKKYTKFVGTVSEQEKAVLMSNAIAFIGASIDEDFGITVVESQMVGTPVIAYKGGGYLETVKENVSGIFFEKPTVESLMKAIQKFEKMKWNEKSICLNAKKFSTANFMKEMKKEVNAVFFSK